MDENCTIEDCEGAKYGRGWCKRHWQRWYRRGDPLAGRPYHRDPEAAFLANTEPLIWSDCIIWTGAGDGRGYGNIWDGSRVVKAHRFAYEREHGTVSARMMVDHRCFNRACVNVEHLRLATPQQNARNRSGATRGSALPRGVDRYRGGYRAQVGTMGVNHHLGSYATVEEASAVAEAKRKELFGEYAGRA